MELTFELELPDGTLRPVTVLGAERPTIAQIERRLATILAGEGSSIDPEDLRLRSPRLRRDLLGPRTLVREGIEDGERLHLRSATEPASAAAAAGPPRPAPPRLPVPALLGAVAVGAVIACAGFGLATMLRDDDPAAPETAVAASGATDYGIEPAYEEVPTESEAAGAATLDEDSVPAEDVVEDPAPPEPETISAAFEGGEWVQLASFRGSEAAWSEAERLTAAGIDATVIDSGDAVELFPGFHIVAAGPFADSGDRRRTLRSARAAGIADAKARELTPAGTALDMASLMGGYEGEIEFIDTRTPGGNRTMPASLFVSEDGAAQLSYENPRCNASLEQVGADRAVGTWDQVVDGGNCIKGGTWKLKQASDDELLMSWERDGTTRWMAGRFTREDG